jgi:F-type H+-transporting ATPase subunit b
VKEAASNAAKSTVTASEGLLHNPYTWITVSFVIFLAVFIKYVWPAIAKGLDARAATIRDQLEQANRLRAEAEALLAASQQQQKDMLKEAETIVANAQRDAGLIRTRAAEDLKQGLDRRAQQAQEKIARAEADAVAQIRTRIVESATQSARSLLANDSNAAQDTQSIDRALKAIAQQVH